MTLFTSSATHKTSTNITGNFTNLNHNYNIIVCITVIINIVIANAEPPTSSASESNLIYWPGNYVSTFIISAQLIVMIFSAL